MSDGGEVSIRFTSKQQEQLWQSFAQLAAKMAGAQQQTEEAAGSTLKASLALKRLADNTKLLIATPAEELARAVKGLDEALAANLLTAEEHGRAVLVHQERYQKALEATDVALIAQREAAKQSAKEQELAAKAKEKAEDQAARKAERDLERQQATLAKVDEQWERYAESMRAATRTPLETLQAKYEKLREAIARGKLTSQEAAVAAKRHQDEYQRELDETRGKQAAVGASAVATGSLIASAWQTALGKVQQIATAMRAENERAMAVQQSVGKSLGSLAQIAKSPEDMAKLTALARDLVASGEAADMSAAVDVVNKARSTGSEADLEKLRPLAASGVISGLPQLFEAAAALQTSFGREGAGGVADLMAKAKIISGESSQMLEPILVGAARAGSQAKTQGISIEDLLAGTGIVATARGSAEEGGTRMAALLRGMEDDQEIRGLSLPDAIAKIQSRNLAPEELTKQLTAEGADAFRILAGQLQKLTDVSRDAAGQVTDVTLATMQQLAVGDAAVNDEMLAKQVKATADMQREKEGRVLVLQEAAIEQGVGERRAGFRGGLVGRSVGQFFGVGGLMESQTANELGAMVYGGFMRNIFANAPGNKLAESMAGSERTAPAIREALAAAIAERDAERERFAASLKSSSEKFERGAAAMERMANRQANIRPDLIGPARREAAVAER